ncbi:MAG: LamB/YcsF family protein [Byssovorax sp.]
MPLVDLNIDLGETPGEPAALYALATVVNIAAGGHAGDKASMARAVSFAMTRGAKVAAHPSYPDRAGFGRVVIDLDPAAIAATVEEQCAALQGIARRLGYPAGIVKPHGALYHEAAKSAAVARALIEGALAGLGVEDMVVVGPPRGALLDEALRRGLRYAREGFADRAYRADGSLVPRSERGALVVDAGACARQAVALAATGTIETICVHGDTEGAVAIASGVRDALLGNGYLAGAI